mmetsp:Transcript_3032/g.6074  ORF Transcript_3032/g.6074 Transcript_3032/m.6074 type:complete len:107 (-) Transcript_3032:156-476(-)
MRSDRNRARVLQETACPQLTGVGEGAVLPRGKRHRENENCCYEDDSLHENGAEGIFLARLLEDPSNMWGLPAARMTWSSRKMGTPSGSVQGNLRMISACYDGFSKN